MMCRPEKRVGERCVEADEISGGEKTRNYMGKFLCTVVCYVEGTSQKVG